MEGQSEQDDSENNPMDDESQHKNQVPGTSGPSGQTPLLVPVISQGKLKGLIEMDPAACDDIVQSVLVSVPKAVSNVPHVERNAGQMHSPPRDQIESTILVQSATGQNSSSKESPKNKKCIDRWQSGTCEIHFSAEDVSGFADVLDAVKTDWALRATGGIPTDKNGTFDSPTPEGGYRARKSCLGLLVCSNNYNRKECEQIQVRPAARPEKLKDQLENEVCKLCKCPLRQIKCDVKQDTIRYSKGLIYKCTGEHMHARPLPIHLSEEQTQRLEALVRNRGHANALSLAIGKQGPLGRTEKATDIAEAFCSTDRIRYEIRKLRESLQRGSQDEALFRAMERIADQYPRFCIDGYFQNGIIVFCFQSEFMATRACETGDDSATNAIDGFVTDGAHKFFKGNKYILVTTCRYCQVLHRWIPILMSFCNGQAADHYEIHFKRLMKSVYDTHLSKGLTFTFEFLANVMDFSAAQRNGFVRAFLSFYKEYFDKAHDDSLLIDKALALLKGCRFHYMEGVRRVKKSGVIPLEHQAAFGRLAYRLVEIEDAQEFEELANRIESEFPATKNWMVWWRDPRVAGMIFPSQSGMHPDRFKEIPDTSNPQESVHAWFYQACGTNKDFITGCEDLREAADLLEKDYNFTLRGGKSRYGTQEFWKDNKKLYGTTHPERIKSLNKREYPNDGRSPDTFETLTKKPKPEPVKARSPSKGNSKGRKPSQMPLQKPTYSFRQDSNSCWVDVALEVIYCCFQRDHSSFLKALGSIPVNSLLHLVLTNVLLRERVDQVDDPETYSISVLGTARNNLRKALVDAKVLKHMYEQSSVIGWLEYALARPRTLSKPGLPYSTECFFVMQVLTVRKCPGERTSHMQVDRFPQQKHHLLCDKDRYLDYDGGAQQYLQSLADPSWEQDFVTAGPCWRNCDTKQGCKCIATTKQFILSYPILLPFEISDELITNTVMRKEFVWNFPPTITFVVSDQEFHYDIVGRTYFGKDKKHFTASLADKDNMAFTYDDIGGMVQPSPLPISESVAGAQTPSNGSASNVVFYHLRGGYDTQITLTSLTREILADMHSLSFTDYSDEQLPVIHLGLHDYVALSTREMGNWIKRPESYHARDYDQIAEPVSNPPLTQHGSKTEPTRSTKFPPIDLAKQNTEIPVTQTVNSSPVQVDLHQFQEITKVLLSGHDSEDIMIDQNITNQLSTPTNEVEMVPRSLTEPLVEDQGIDVASGIDQLQKDQLPQTIKRNPFTNPFSSSSQVSVADDEEWWKSCRCGSVERRVGREIDQNVVLCTKCKRWSHVACQHGGLTNFLEEGDPFFCHNCMVPSLNNLDVAHIDKEQEVRIYEAMQMRRASDNKEERIWPGRGVLVRSPVDKKYWIPARAIVCPERNDRHPLWVVKLWRGCLFKKSQPESLTIHVEKKDIEDDLYGKKRERRRIRLGKWKHAFEIQDYDNTLDNFRFTPYSEDIHEILKPHLRHLKLLLIGKGPKTKIPILKFLKDDDVKASAKEKIMYAAGSLDLQTQAQVANWLSRNLPLGDHPETIPRWFHRECMVHAITLVIASRRDVSVEVALRIQQSEICLKRPPVDVDRECLYDLEMRMFDNSKSAGDAGNRQWGLDAGAHQYGWNPYEGTDYYFPENNYIYRSDDNEEDYQVGRLYSEGSDAEANRAPIPKRPKARPRQKFPDNV